MSPAADVQQEAHLWAAVRETVEPGTWRTLGVLKFPEGTVAAESIAVAGVIPTDGGPVPVETKEQVSIWCPDVHSGWLTLGQFAKACQGVRFTGDVVVWGKNDSKLRLDVLVRVRHEKGEETPSPTDGTADYYASKEWKRTTYLGVPVLKHPCDLWVMQEILHDVRPDLVIETGTFRGGSALFYAETLTGINNGRVVTIDVKDEADLAMTGHGRITRLHGSSVSPEILDIVGDLDRLTKADVLARGGKTLVVLDSDHSYDHVLAELRAYAPLVSEGSYLVVEDTNTPGPAEAVKDFLSSPEGSSFVVDRGREKFSTSFNAGGWLYRPIVEGRPQ